MKLHRGVHVLWVAVLCSALSVRAADFGPWSRTAPIQFTGYTASGTLTNFPALVVLGTNISGFSYADFRSGVRDDLRFASTNGDELNYEIDTWNTNGQSLVWVQVPALQDTNTSIRAYWGCRGVAAPACTTNGATWSEGYAGVWHLKEASGTCYDSTAYANNGSPSNATLGAQGRIGTAASFDGTSNCWIQVPDHASLRGMTNLTLEAWVYDVRNDQSPAGILSKRLGSGTAVCYYLFKGTGTNISFFVNQSNGNMITNTATGGNAWRYVAATFDPSLGSAQEKVFIDGSLRGATNNLQPAVTNLVSPLCIGTLNPAYSNAWKGQIDEARVSRVTRSPNWVWAGFMSAASNTSFTAYGAASPALDIRNTGVSNITAGTALACGTLAATGGAPVTVFVYSGPVNGGTNAAAWAATNTFADPQPAGPLATTIPLLASNATYYFRYCATNDYGTAWATSSLAFGAYALNVSATDPTAAEDGADPGVFTISRPPAATNDALTVNVSFGGTATPGTDFVSPGSSVVIPAGAASVTVTITPLRDMVAEPAETVSLTLAPGAYNIGDTPSATVTIASDELTGWAHRASLVFSGYDRPETLTNFPALVYLGSNLTGFSYADFASGTNGDLRFSDASGTNELAYEVDQWDTNGTSAVWVRVPRLEDTNTCIWAYWGRSGATTPPYATNGTTWAQDYRGVWHLGATNDAGRLPNSAQPLYYGTNVGGAAAATGQIGGARSFNGSNQRIDLGAAMPNGPYTKMVWFYLANTNVNNNLMSGTNNTHAFFFSTGSRSLRSGHNGSWNMVVDPQSAAISNWGFGSVTFDGPAGSPGTMILYRDGAEVSRSNNVPARAASAMDYIGAYSGGSYFSGLIDEVELSSVARSSNWIWAAWMNQASNAMFATAQLASPAIANLDASGVTAGSATLNGTLIATGQAPATVIVYWGPADGGTNPAAWLTSVTLPGSPAAGPVAATVAPAPNGLYWYRYRAVSALGESWSPSATAFITGEIGIQAADASASETGPDTGAFSVSRPDWATGATLRAYYALSGTASNGVDYATLPGWIDLPAGATNALITVMPLADTQYFEDPETVTATLLDGAYVVGSATSATVTLANQQPSTVAVVSGAGSDTTGNGSFATPYRSITRALTNSPAYTLVYVGSGTYATNNGETFPLNVPAGTSLIGLGGPADAIIDANGTNSGMVLNNTTATNLISNLSLVRTRGTAITATLWQGTLDNVVISSVTNGGATANTSVFYYNGNNASRKVTFSRLVVTNVACNVQKLLCFAGTNCTHTTLFTNCTFRGLSTTVGASQANGNFHFGSSGYNVTLADCLFDTITVPSTTSYEGGVLYNGNTSTTLFSMDRCVFRNITVTGTDGSMLYSPNRIASTTYARVRDCLFQNVNCGPTNGAYSGAIGGFRSGPGVRNCTFHNVTAVFRSNNDANYGMYAYNCIVQDCGRLSMRNPDYLTLFNVNVKNTDAGAGYNEPNSPNVTSLDPWFVDTAASNFHLRTLSPLVDAGSNAYVQTATDLGGTPRILDGNADGTAVVDLGAYEANFQAPTAPRFQTALPLYNVNGGQTLNVPVWIQPAAPGAVTAAVSYGTNVSGVATLTFPTGNETNVLAITVQSPLTVANGTLVAVSLTESGTNQGVATGDIGLRLYSSIVTVPGYQARTFVRAGTTNQYRVQMPDATLTAGSDLTVTVGAVGGTGSNEVQWIGSNVITAGGWRTEGYLQVVGRGGESTITLSIGGGMTFAESGATDLAFAFVGYAPPLYVAPSGSDATGLGTTGSPLRSLTCAVPVLQAGDEVRMAAGLYSTNSGEVFPITVPEGIVVRGTLGPGGSPSDSSVVDANRSGFNFVLGTLAADPGLQGEGGLYNVVMTNAGGTAIYARYWSGIISNCVIRDVANGGAQDSTAGLRVDNNARNVRLVDLTMTNIASSASRLVLMEGGTNATLTRCQFRNLSVSAQPSDGVFAFKDHAVTLTDCTFANLAWVGANGNPNECGFLRNYGAVQASLVIERCVFRDLSVTGGGSDMVLCWNRTSPSLLRNSLFYNIAASPARPTIGHFYCNVSVRNCTIDNASTAFGPASGGNTTTVYNTSVSSCAGLNSMSGSRLVLKNVNIYGTPGGVGYVTNESSAVTAFDPQYRYASQGNYQLLLSSPLVDAGNTNYVAGTYDLALTNRVLGASVDVGAYEAVPEPRGTVFTLE